jgi:glycosyltransferase involved in cell wall biosynthesis
MGLGVASKRIIIITPPSLLSIFVGSLKLLQKKIAVDITDIWHEEAQHLGYIKISLFASLSRGLELLALKLADIVTVATYSIKKYYVSSLGEEDKIHLLPTPLDDSLLKICKETRFKQRANELYNVIVYAGNFGKPQALDFAIKAFSILNKENVKVRLLLVGGGEEEEYLKHLIKLHKIDNVEIRPPVPREKLFNYIYKQSIAGLVALAFNKVLFYAIPTKLYEYIMCGLPFISYGSSVEIKRLSFITKSGIHVSEPEPSKLAEGIKYLMNNIAQFVENANKVSPQLLQQIDNALKLIIE